MAHDIYQYLGFPEGQRPRTHYELLGVSPAVQDPNVIRAAAKNCLAQLNAVRGTDPARDRDVDALSDELNRALRTLLDPAARRQYDATITPAAQPWWQPEDAAPAAPPAPADDWWKDHVEAPPKPAPAPPAAPAPKGDAWWKDGAPPPSAPVPPARDETPSPEPIDLDDVSPRRARRRENSGLALVLVVFLLVAGAVAGVIYYVTREKPAQDTKQVAQNPPEEPPAPVRKTGDSPVQKKETGPKVIVPEPKKVYPQPVKKDPEPVKADPEPKKVEPEPKKPEPEPKKVEPPPPKVEAEFAEARTFGGQKGTVLGLAVSGDAKRFLSVSNDRSVMLHRTDGEKPAVLHKLNSEGVAGALCDNDRLAVFCDGGDLIVYDLERGQVKRRFSNPRGGVECLAAAPDGRFVLTGATDGCVRWWDVAGSKLEHTFDIDAKATITALAVAADGLTAVVGLSDGRAVTWDLKKKREIKRWRASTGRITTASLSPDGRLMALGAEDGAARVWKTEGVYVQKLDGHKGAVLGVGWCSDSRRVVTGGIDRKLILWDAVGGRKAGWAAQAEEKVFSVAVDARDRFVLAGQSDGIVQLLPLPQRELLPAPAELKE